MREHDQGSHPRRCVALVVCLLVAILAARAIRGGWSGLEPSQRTAAQVVSAGASAAVPASPVPAALFGLHIHRAATTTPWPASPFGSWRLHDAYVAWPNLEPNRNDWRFDVLDRYVALAAANGVELLLPLELSPTWASARPRESSAYGPGNAAEPADINDWITYVRTVAQRYRGQIHYYEIWNEPNLRQFYSGSATNMVQLARAAYTNLKQIDPTILVVGPSTTGGDTRWIDGYFKRGGAAWLDIMGYHFYVWPDPPETMLPLVSAVRAVMARYGLSARPLWNTEAGWFIADQYTTVVAPPGNRVLSATEASAFVARAYAVNWSSGIERFHFYAWDDNAMGLTEADGVTLKPPAQAYAQVDQWMVGATLGGCSNDAGGTWICSFTRPAGYAAWMVWNTVGATTLAIPGDWAVTRLRDLSGNTTTLSGVAAIPIDISPVLLERP
jgi:hypothetical protein